MILADQEKIAIKYHDIFDFPLNFADIVKWKVGEKFKIINFKLKITNKNRYFYLEGRDGLIYKRNLRKRISTKKLLVAKKAAHILSFIPTIKMVAVTGSLAMENSSQDSDIDLMIVTRKGMLWTTRPLAYVLLWIFGLKSRISFNKSKINMFSYIVALFEIFRTFDTKIKMETDRLCTNMWLDEEDLEWNKKDRNLYTAHEIAQIIPLVNKNKTYEKFLYINKWILDFWPNSVRVTKLQSYKVTKRSFFASVTLSLCNSLISVFEEMAYKIQRIYMQKKVTREVITSTRALFHPNDWGKIVMGKLNSTPR